MNNPIQPDYYNDGELTFADFIKTKFTKEELMIVDQFQIYKYLWRFKKKNGVEDLEKCEWYLKDLIKYYKSENK